MLGYNRKIAQLTSDYQLLAERVASFECDMHSRIQRREAELMAPKLDRLLRELHPAAQLAAEQSCQSALSVQSAMRAVVAPLPRGRAGGLARANTAWRD